MADLFDEHDLLVDRARQLLQAGDFLLAERSASAALQRIPASVAALAMLGAALHAQDKFTEAERAFLQLTQIDVGNPMNWMNVGTARRCAGQIDSALFAFARAAALGAKSADFYYNVALAHIDRNDYESARAVLASAFALAPDDAEIRYRYALSCYECMQTDEALAALDGWNEQSIAESVVSADIGHLLMKLGEPVRAEPAVRQAVRSSPQSAQARLTLAQLLERTNRNAEAESLVAELAADAAAVTELSSDITLLQAQLAQRRGEHELAVSLFRQVLGACNELHNRHFQEYPLAKSLDSASRYEEAFATLTDAHRSQVAYLQRTSPLFVARGAPALSIAEHSAVAADVAGWDHRNAPSAQASPVFIVAFPRSGTTLLELTLDAHPQLVSMDEQPFLQNSLDDVLALGVRYPGHLAQLTDVQLDALRDKYWQRVARKVTVQPGQRLIDKNPLNLLRLPLIKRLFPNAHVIVVIRHPCDVLLSCFMQHFRAPDFALLCRDLPTLTAGYVKAFDFWDRQQKLLQANVMELRYESFVESFAMQTRELFEFINVAWDDRVLEPAARALEKRFISTPSYSQVVQPVTSRAVGRWRNYQRHFDVVLPMLRPRLDEWGYDA